MNVTIVDIETTGLSRYRHKITEIAAVKVRNGEIVSEFSTLVNPESPIPKFITRLTGITDELVADAPKTKDAIKNFLDFLEDDLLVAHNAAFDYGFLAHYAQQELGVAMKPQKICTRKLATRLLPQLPSRKLSDICEYFSIENETAHRAMSDVVATHGAFIRMCQILEECDVCKTEDLVEFECMPVAKAQRLLFD